MADPQIQGELAVAPPLSYLYNWDSDRRVLLIPFNQAKKMFSIIKICIELTACMINKIKLSILKGTQIL